MSEPEAVDVAVIGAGPTGLFAAILLVRSGLRVRILDQNAAPARESRAFVIHARTLELLGSVDLAERFLDRGLIATGARIVVEGREAATLAFDDIGATGTPYPFVLVLPQAETEEILAEALRELGVEVERGVAVESLSQDQGGVSVQGVDRDGAPVHVRASYLVGADGAHSVVRKELGLSFEGAAYDQSFLLADCHIDAPLDWSRVGLFLGARGFGLYLPLKGRSVGRIIVTDPEGPEAGPQGAAPATLDEIERAFRAASGLDARLSDPVWVTRYRIHHRAVDRYGQGRVFVAGDAAHIHSPAGGQGMNTGLGDAANLAWKLAAVVRGAPPDLLDTYHSERWPVGQRLLRVTDRLFGRMTARSRLEVGLRNALVPVFAGSITRFAPARARAFRFVSQLGIRYGESRFVRDATSVERSGGIAAGRRAPNALIRRGLDVFALIGGYKFSVLALSREALGGPELDRLHTALDGLATPQGPLPVHIVANSLVGRDPRLIQAEGGEVFRAYELDESRSQALLLIRPDGHIAWRSNRLDAAGLRAFLGGSFGSGPDAKG